MLETPLKRMLKHCLRLIVRTNCAGVPKMSVVALIDVEVVGYIHGYLGICNSNGSNQLVPR